MNNHSRFLRHLDQSQAGVARVAKWIATAGGRPVVPETTRASRASEWKRHADDGDILLANPERRIEVKHIQQDFTCAADWPFSRMMVCGKAAFDRANPKPLAIVQLNREMTHVAVIMGADHPDWWWERTRDSRYEGYSQEVYFTRPDRPRYFSLEEESLNEEMEAPNGLRAED